MNSEPQKEAWKTHDLILKSRRELMVTGVDEVSVFDENKISLTTALGDMTVTGGDLRIEKFSQETGELSLIGEIDGLQYAENKKDTGGFWAKLFR